LNEGGERERIKGLESMEGAESKKRYAGENRFYKGGKRKISLWGYKKTEVTLVDCGKRFRRSKQSLETFLEY